MATKTTKKGRLGVGHALVPPKLIKKTIIPGAVVPLQMPRKPTKPPSSTSTGKKEK